MGVHTRVHTRHGPIWDDTKQNEKSRVTHAAPITQDISAHGEPPGSTRRGQAAWPARGADDVTSPEVSEAAPSSQA